MRRTAGLACALLGLAVAVWSEPAEPRARFTPDPAEGLRLLLEKEFLPPAFDQETFDELWRVWPTELRARAKNAERPERRRMAMERYGLHPRPGDRRGRPLQYVVSDAGQWTLNCFACHGGQVGGRVIAGLPNSNLALHTLTADVRLTKLRLKKRLADMELGALLIPLGSSNGTTNAVMFGVALMHGRGDDLEPAVRPQRLTFDHHDMDAPPWWHFKKKTRLYADNFAQKHHRALMQFMLVPRNSAALVKSWENDFRHIAAYLESIEAPRWPHAIDEDLAKQGKRVFEKTCARCHGTYGEDGDYPEKVVALDDVGTDPVRLHALRPWQRREYGKSWFTDYGKRAVVVRPEGYVAPPLDGVWASAPYFHNGSVPTLWHVLHSKDRPRVWKRTRTGYDKKRVGLEVTEYRERPRGPTGKSKREFFDTRIRGKSAKGHTYPDDLTEPQKIALLEYLKTL